LSKAVVVALLEECFVVLVVAALMEECFVVAAELFVVGVEQLAVVVDRVNVVLVYYYYSYVDDHNYQANAVGFVVEHCHEVVDPDHRTVLFHALGKVTIHRNPWRTNSVGMQTVRLLVWLWSCCLFFCRFVPRDLVSFFP